MPNVDFDGNDFGFGFDLGKKKPKEETDAVIPSKGSQEKLPATVNPKEGKKGGDAPSVKKKRKVGVELNSLPMVQYQEVHFLLPFEHYAFLKVASMKKGLNLSSFIRGLISEHIQENIEQFESFKKMYYGKEQ